MAQNFGIYGDVKYYSKSGIAGLTLPATTTGWAVAFTVRLRADRVDGTDRASNNWIFCTGPTSYADANALNIAWKWGSGSNAVEAANGTTNDNNLLIAWVEGLNGQSYTATVPLLADHLSNVTFPPDNTLWYVAVVYTPTNATSGTLTMLRCSQGGTAQVINTAAITSGVANIPITSLYFGTRSDRLTDRKFNDDLGPWAILNKPITTAQLQSWAVGDKNIQSVAGLAAGDFLMNFNQEAPAATLDDMAAGNNDLTATGTTTATGYSFVTAASFPTTVVLDDTGDGEYIDHVGSTVTGATTGSPTIKLTVVDQPDTSGFLNIHGRISGLLGKTATFVLDEVMAYWRGGNGFTPKGAWEPVWRYLSDDPITGWRKFDTFNNSAGTGGRRVIISTKTSAFTEDVIVYGFKPPIRYADLQTKFAQWAASAIGSKPAAAINAGTTGPHWVAQHTTLAGQPNAAPIGATLNQFAVRLTSPTQPAGGARKIRMVMVLRQHPQEQEGFLAAVNRIDNFINRTGAVADRLRQNIDLLAVVTNVTGVYNAKERFTADDSTPIDPNRSWYLSGLSPQTDAAKAAITKQFPQGFDVFFDADHGDYTLDGSLNQLLAFVDVNDAKQISLLSRYNTKAVPDIVQGTENYGVEWDRPASGWAWLQNLTQISMTLEHPEAWPGYPAMSAWDATSIAFWDTIDDMVLSGEINVSATRPVTTRRPAITGNLTQGSVITLDPGTWTNSPSTANVLRRNSGPLNDRVVVTGNTYTIQAVDVGCTLTYEVTATNGTTYSRGTSLTSELVVASGLGLPSPSSPPLISGTAQVGQTLSVSDGIWSNTPSGFTRQWRKNGMNIAGATGATYVLQPGDAGGSITAAVTATNATGQGAPAFSEPVVAAAAGGSDSVTLTGIVANRIYQRAAGTTARSMVIAGSYTGSPTTIQARVIDVDTTAALPGLDWQTVVSSPTGGAYTANLTVPQGGQYIVQVRFSNAIAVNAASPAFSVGVVMLIYGGTNALALTTETAAAATPVGINRVLKASNWVVPSANGEVALLNRLSVAVGAPVGLLAAGANDALSVNLMPGGSHYTALQTTLATIDNDVELVLLQSGEADLSVIEADYKSRMTAIYDGLRTITGRSISQLRCLIAQMGADPNGAGAPAAWAALRKWQWECGFAVSGAYLSHCMIDLPVQAGGYKLTAAACGEAADRAARAAVHALGLTSSRPFGPQLSAVYRSGAAVTVLLTHQHGTGLQDLAGNETGFEVSKDDFATLLPITTVAPLQPDKVVLTLAADPAAPVKVRYGYGRAPNMTQPIYDNAA
jgi:hypothetical protein